MSVKISYGNKVAGYSDSPIALFLVSYTLINTIKLRKGNEQNVNFAKKHLTKRRKSAVSLPAAMKPIEIGV